jgi:hypothetical protein
VKRRNHSEIVLAKCVLARLANHSSRPQRPHPAGPAFIPHLPFHLRFLNSRNPSFFSQSSPVLFHLPVADNISARVSHSSFFGCAESFGDSEACSRRMERVRGAGLVAREKM